VRPHTLAEIIRAFCADALSSTINLNVDLDIMLAVLAQALLVALRARLPGYHAEGPCGDPHGVVRILTIDLGSHSLT
jgi:hypothetical protein